MKPADHPITVYRGDSYELFFRLRERIWNAATNEFIPGDYIPMTGWTGKAQIREDEDSTQVLAEMTVTLGDQGTTPGSGFVRMTPTLTATITVPTAKWDLQFTKADSSVQTYLAGDVTVIPDVTRS